jgi:hypothetical protein
VADSAAGAHFFDAYPQLGPAENWLLQRAPWVICFIAFGWAASWEPNTTPAMLNLTYLVHVTLLSSSARERQHLLDYFAEHEAVAARRWA